jgi:hypothetical protein
MIHNNHVINITLQDLPTVQITYKDPSDCLKLSNTEPTSDYSHERYDIVATIRENGSEAFILTKEAFYRLCSAANLVKIIHCPSCLTTKCVKSGKSYKGGQLYRCRNAACSRQLFTVNT